MSLCSVTVCDFYWCLCHLFCLLCKTLFLKKTTSSWNCIQITGWWLVVIPVFSPIEAFSCIFNNWSILLLWKPVSFTLLLGVRVQNCEHCMCVCMHVYVHVCVWFWTVHFTFLFTFLFAYILNCEANSLSYCFWFFLTHLVSFSIHRLACNI